MVAPLSLFETPAAVSYRRRQLTRAAIEGAAATIDELGEEEARRRYGYGVGKAAHRVTVGERTYDSKLLVGLAAGLGAKQHSGGKAHALRVLERLGFRTGAVAWVCVAAGVLAAAHPAFGAVEGDDIRASYYASGSNRPGHIQGFSDLGQAVGVAAPDLDREGEDALHALAGTGVQVFVDSGAFSEVEFNVPHKCSSSAACKAGECVGNGELPRVELPVGAPFTAAPIEHADWLRILDLYARLALSLGDQLHVVAPDKVAHADETLARLRRYQPRLCELLDLGAHVLCVAQGTPEGAEVPEQLRVDHVEVDREIERILGRSDYTRALPCKKNATSVAQVRRFAAQRRPERLHCLGLGIRNHDAARVAQAIVDESPDTLLSFDSCLLRESCGKANGRASHPAETHKGRRLLTAAKDIVAARDGFSPRTKDQEWHRRAIRLAWDEGAAWVQAAYAARG